MSGKTVAVIALQFIDRSGGGKRACAPSFTANSVVRGARGRPAQRSVPSAAPSVGSKTIRHVSSPEAMHCSWEFFCAVITVEAHAGQSKNSNGARDHAEPSPSNKRPRRTPAKAETD